MSWINYIMITTKQSTVKPCAYFMGYGVCRTGPDKMADILQTAFLSSFLFANRFILAENCFNSFPRSKPIVWINEGPNLEEGPARGITRQKESRWIIKTFTRKSRPIQCVELYHQSGSRKQHCWKFWNPRERIVMPRYVFLYFLVAFAVFCCCFFFT